MQRVRQALATVPPQSQSVPRATVSATASLWHREATWFLVADGHELPEHESVRQRRRGYMVVEKMTRGLRLAVRRTDPRAGPA